ncbi:unnamed protein product [Penicillium salamii]|uniref:DUF1917-domain-containing protein n=1 Tax=Penicillium salamii TaxID=1612424 RepID=A0A9W4NJE3_9EURO|nr:unnamed protein product [Penicillium salamii]
MILTETPDQIFSDESSFYGDEEETARLEAQVASYDSEPYWGEYHQNILSTKYYNLQNPMSSDVSMRDASPPPTSTSTSLPQDRRGRTESVAQFLSRLPPSTTELTSSRPWIWMHNRQIPSKEGDVPALLRKGHGLLQDYENESALLREAHDKSGTKITAGLTRKLNRLRKELENDLLALARDTGVTHGKWMLFPTVDQVDECWGTVARAMEEGELGDCAKVAPNDGSGQARLVCVYTADFGDAEDVKRVVKKMVDLGLLGKNARPIYYKSDVYTLLDITSKNDYGLKASMFCSRDVLKEN